MGEAIMTGISSPDAAPTSDEDLMARYGIERVPVDRFHYKAYRYSSLADAVKQAQRDQPDTPS
jgi:hypothetical protein